MDIIYANTWPIFAMGLSTLAAKLKGFKIILSVQDLYPEVLIAQKRFPEKSLIVEFLKYLDACIVKSSYHLIVICKSFEDVYIRKRKINKNKVSIVKNWIKNEKIQKLDTSQSRIKLERFINYKFNKNDCICIYGGNISSSSGLLEFLDYINLIDQRFKFVIVVNNRMNWIFCISNNDSKTE